MIVDSAKYPPAGSRGAAFGVAHDDYSGGDVMAEDGAAPTRRCCSSPRSRRRGARERRGIAAVDGIDVLWIGHFDLTNSMGIPGQFDPPGLPGGRRPGVRGLPTDTARPPGFMASERGRRRRALSSRGFRCLAYWGDLWIYQQALRQGIAAIRAGLTARA